MMKGNLEKIISPVLKIRPVELNIGYGAIPSKVLLLAHTIGERLNFILAQESLSLEHGKCINWLAQVNIVFKFCHFLKI